MACGSPVIGSNIGGLKSYIKDGVNGFLFSPGDVDDLFFKMESFLFLNSHDKLILAENSILTAKKYSKDKVAKDMLCFLDLFKRK